VSIVKSSQAACPSKRLNNRIKDNAVADSLAERLGTDGMKVWLGESVLQPGGSIPANCEARRNLVHTFDHAWEAP
jgi:hypothetical protein